ncbi:MAG: hypothetical protein AAFQ32_00535 [Pseudomonadota bacterium]
MGHGGACPQDDLRDIQRAFQDLSNTRDAALVANCMGNMACINAAQAETITPDLLQETLYDAGFGDYGIGFGANATTKGAIWAEARRDARALSGIAAHCTAGDADCLGKAQAEGLANLVTLGAYDSALALAGCAGGMTLDACRQTLVEAGVGVVSVGAGVVVAKVGGKLLRVTRKGDGFQAAAGATNRLPNPPNLTISNSQWGTKSAQHMRDFDLDVSNPAHRQQFRDMVENIGSNPDRVVTGTFSGGGPTGRRDVLFYLRGSDVVVTSPAGEFVTVLQNGVTNPNVVRALGR